MNCPECGARVSSPHGLRIHQTFVHKVTPLEWRIKRLLYSRGPMTLRDLVKALAGELGCLDGIERTLENMLAEKVLVKRIGVIDGKLATFIDLSSHTRRIMDKKVRG